MIITPAQKTIFLNDINAKSATGQPLEGMVSSQNYAWIRDYYNTASGSFAWNANTPVEAIYNTINWTNYTPADVPTASDTPAVAVHFANRSSLIGIKQRNLQSILWGRTYLNCTNAWTRAGLRDCLVQLPAGAGGAMVSAWWASAITTLTACTRSCNRAEFLFAPAPVVTGTVSAVVLPIEGTVDEQQIRDIITL